MESTGFIEFYNKIRFMCLVTGGGGSSSSSSGDIREDLFGYSFYSFLCWKCFFVDDLLTKDFFFFFFKKTCVIVFFMTKV